MLISELWIQEEKKGIWRFKHDKSIYIHKYVGCGDSLYLTARVHGLDMFNLNTECLDLAIEKATEILVVCTSNLRTSLTTTLNALTVEAQRIKEIKDAINIKPRCQLSGVNGNIFSIITAVSTSLKLSGQVDRAKDFEKKAMSGNYTYSQILGTLVYDYVIVE